MFVSSSHLCHLQTFVLAQKYDITKHLKHLMVVEKAGYAVITNLDTLYPTSNVKNVRHATKSRASAEFEQIETPTEDFEVISKIDTTLSDKIKKGVRVFSRHP